jgi:hypothetical protein
MYAFGKTLLAGTAVFVLATIPLVAAQPAIILPAEDTFRPGSVIAVAWENLPAGVEELEFLLVRGDRREEIVRLTPQLLPERGSFQWQVPNLSADAALLRLRVGIDDEERDIANSKTFTIAGGRDEESLVFRDGEWWIPLVGRSTASRALGDRITPSRLRGAVAMVRSRRFTGTLPPVIVAIAPAVSVIVSPSNLALSSRAPLVIPQRE